MLRLNRINFKRFNSHGAHGAHGAKPTPSTFTNKYNFNIDPPQVHEYWNIRNTSVVIAFIPVFFGVTYLTKVASDGNDGFGGLLAFANGEQSPMKDIKFSEPQK
ncbi:hypothetical protein CLIB1444_02S17238 [[Candida] jaroonii]|uniref:Uncharacterized protein n=1 Tax=[Candida] jaroonii TaxID=467808 RepID=A0ACA9Y4H0_9ASCO|nr:hypothetical protein CLIB1444_02S17238 [[Candida] jaroonii]